MLRTFIVASILALGVQSQAIESIKAAHVDVSFVAPEQFSQQATTIGIRYKLAPHWHVYWKNPGDSGASPKFEFEGADAGPILWPIPTRLPVGDLVNVGYENEVILPFTLAPSGDAVNLNAKLEWLVCEEGECVPGFATLSLKRKVGAVELFKEKANVERYLRRVPGDSSKSPLKVAKIRAGKDEIRVSVQGSVTDLFPTDGLRFKPQAPSITKDGDITTFVVKLQPSQQVPPATGFVLTSGQQAWEWTDETIAPLVFEPTPIDLTSLLILFLSAFVGGIVLNFMPCVLPVLSIKFLSLAKTPAKDRLREALLYTAGVLVTFTALGAGFLALRTAGASVGWGFQLQSPAVVLALVILFWLMALNFLGVFEFGTSVMNAAGNTRFNGAFATGVLSVFVAAPCTGPFMGSALGAAATLPSLQSLAIFFFLGLGLASPFILVAISPHARKVIPKPGAWMETLKQFFAFPLIATVIWLLWVLHLQVGLDALPLTLGLLMFLAFAFWWKSKVGKATSLIAILALSSVVFVEFDVHQRSSANEVLNSDWTPFSETAVEDARKQGQAVFIDFTAAWCITCQVNKRTTLHLPSIEKLFKDQDVALFEADWTKHDPAITAALAKFGRNSVPVYVYYAPRAAEAKILSQILTPSEIEGLFQTTKGD